MTQKHKAGNAGLDNVGRILQVWTMHDWTLMDKCCGSSLNEELAIKPCHSNSASFYSLTYNKQLSNALSNNITNSFFFNWHACKRFVSLNSTRAFGPRPTCQVSHCVLCALLCGSGLL